MMVARNDTINDYIKHVIENTTIEWNESIRKPIKFRKYLQLLQNKCFMSRWVNENIRLL